MTVSFLVKGEDGALRGATPQDEERIKAWTVGSVIECETKRKRNGRHHRKGMALLQFVFEHQERIVTFEHFLIEVKILTGWVDTYVTADGQLIYLPKSISFANMDEDQFCEWRKECLTVIFERFLPDIPPDEYDHVVDTVIGFM